MILVAIAVDVVKQPLVAVHHEIALARRHVAEVVAQWYEHVSVPKQLRLLPVLIEQLDCLCGEIPVQLSHFVGNEHHTRR
jgi:hypothetical protein